MPIAIEVPDVPGDPAGMRALAAALRTDAESAGELGAGLKARFESIEFYGPAADRIEGRTGMLGRACVDVASGLVEVAGLLDTWAARVEAEQAAAARTAAELRAQSVAGLR
jgi:hypothetical protein